MSIRLIAIELYRAQKKVGKLESQLADASINEKDPILEKLRVANAELQHLRKMLDGAKTPAPSSSRSSLFSGRR